MRSAPRLFLGKAITSRIESHCPMSMTSIRQPKKDSISTKYRRQKFGDTWVTVYDVEKDGKKMMLTNKGMEICIDVDVTLKEVKDWTKDDILHNWIEVGRPCTLIHGFRYKGASAHLINQSEALKRIKTHSFGVGYYSMEWTVFNGMAVLQFAEYSESDML